MQRRPLPGDADLPPGECSAAQQESIAIDSQPAPEPAPPPNASERHPPIVAAGSHGRWQSSAGKAPPVSSCRSTAATQRVPLSLGQDGFRRMQPPSTVRTFHLRARLGDPAPCRRGAGGGWSAASSGVDRRRWPQATCRLTDGRLRIGPVWSISPEPCFPGIVESRPRGLPRPGRRLGLASFLVDKGGLGVVCA
jgi:hypothetical protein